MKGEIGMFDPKIEKLRVYQLLQDSTEEYKKYKKRTKLKSSLEIVDEELNKIEQAFKLFESNCKGLVVYDKIFGDYYSEIFHAMINQLRSMFKKHLTKEEVKKLPDFLYYQHIEIERKKLEILNSISKKYLK